MPAKIVNFTKKERIAAVSLYLGEILASIGTRCALCCTWEIRISTVGGEESLLEDCGHGEVRLASK